MDGNGKHVSANTFRSIDLRSQEAAEMSFAEFVKTLLEKLEQLKKERSAFYENLREKYTNWANGARGILTFLGAAAFLLTGVAAAVRFASQTDRFKSLEHVDIVFMIGVLAIYAVMGAITFYEKGTDHPRDSGSLDEGAVRAAQGVERAQGCHRPERGARGA
jgi:hypothetical protein